MLAPAKLNLGLRVTGRRDDGYHTLESVFVPLELGDRLEVSLGAGRGVSLELAGEAAGVPAGEANLAWRAARSFAEAAGLAASVHVRLEKLLPPAAGLGGGSSDAGAVLRALAKLRPGALAPDALAELALALGADVPFFLDPRPAIVTGIGERIEPLAGLRQLDLLLARPEGGLSTAAVYAAWDADPISLTPAGARYSLSRLSASLGENGRLDADALARLVANDLEPSATRSCPDIARLREAMGEVGARVVGMSGSGPTVYGIFESGADARRAREALGGDPAAARGWVAVTRSAAGRESSGASPNW